MSHGKSTFGIEPSSATQMTQIALTKNLFSYVNGICMYVFHMYLIRDKIIKIIEDSTYRVSFIQFGKEQLWYIVKHIHEEQQWFPLPGWLTTL